MFTKLIRKIIVLFTTFYFGMIVMRLVNGYNTIRSEPFGHILTDEQVFEEYVRREKAYVAQGINRYLQNL